MRKTSTVLAVVVVVVLVHVCGGQDSPANNQVCLIVPHDVEECYLRFQGKPIENKAAQVNCLQVGTHRLPLTTALLPVPAIEHEDRLRQAPLLCPNFLN